MGNLQSSGDIDNERLQNQIVMVMTKGTVKNDNDGPTVVGSYERLFKEVIFKERFEGEEKAILPRRRKRLFQGEVLEWGTVCCI